MTDRALAGWGDLPDEAKAGTLKLEPGTIDTMIGHCEKHLSDLQTLSAHAGQMGNISGLESLGSAHEMQTKFNHLATGGPGVYSALDMINDRIKVVTDMRDNLRKTKTAYERADHGAAHAIKRAGGSA